MLKLVRNSLFRNIEIFSHSPKTRTIGPESPHLNINVRHRTNLISPETADLRIYKSKLKHVPNRN